MTVPILYSFRRCPYAIRARLALKYSGVKVEVREVSLKQKPLAMLQHSPKGTVPVLLLPTGEVLEQSLDIMRWALGQNDPEQWLGAAKETPPAPTNSLIAINDEPFKAALDRYKYASRHPEYSQAFYRAAGAEFLAVLEEKLVLHPYLCGTRISVVDVAIFPFIRQFAAVDETWFAESPTPRLRQWLRQFSASPLFESVMAKYPVWHTDSTTRHFL